ncbi:MAG TPA: hypothetical protein VNE83_02390 [Terriglobales bacterium]|nr:hypothetical protein [Terriglobales bacterium]
MAPHNPASSFSFEETARRVEADLRRWISSFNDEVVPALRRDGGKALRRAAEKLAQFADTLDEVQKPPQ